MTITTKDGLPNNTPVAILEHAGDLWVSSDRDIFRIPLKQLTDFLDGRITSISPIVYGIAEGMKSNECNSGGPGVWKTRDGRLWFPTVRGAVVVDPDAGNRLPPPVVLEEASAHEVPLARGGRTSVLPGKNTLDFRFTALSLSAPERVRFKYRLEPFDKDWVDGGSQRTAHYTNMAPGEYSFRVMAANSYGVWNEQGDSVRFVLRPHFYQTRWFYLFAATVIVLCAAGAYRLRIRQLQAREAHLAQLVDSRTMELHAEIKVREEAESGLRQARAELEERVRERTAQLHESEQRFRTFVDHAADALFVLNFEQGTIFDVNREACRSLGYTREELIGGSTTAFDVIVDAAAHNSIAERAAAGESVVDVHRHQRKDGSVFSVEVHTSLVWFGGQRFLLKIARDITDRLHAEQERERLRQLEADLAHINRVSMMGELAASVAHEVNQPLTGI
jgi:PAS domain S-box-containing protein